MTLRTRTDKREERATAVLDAGEAPASTAPAATSGARGGMGWKRTFAALSQRDYSVYFFGNMAFFLAMQMNLILRGWLAFDLTDSVAAVGYVSVGAALPMLFVAPIGGVLADLV